MDYLWSLASYFQNTDGSENRQNKKGGDMTKQFVKETFMSCQSV